MSFNVMILLLTYESYQVSQCDLFVSHKYFLYRGGGKRFMEKLEIPIQDFKSTPSLSLMHRRAENYQQ